MGRPASPSRLLESLLRIPARGLTNIYFPLQVAGRELAAISARDARVLLLSTAYTTRAPTHALSPQPSLAWMS